jgi:hypothetical protein
MGVSGQLHAPAALPPGEKPPVPIGQEAGWAPEPVSKLWSTEISLAPAGNRIPAVQPVARRYTNRAILTSTWMDWTSKINYIMQGKGKAFPVLN